MLDGDVWCINMDVASSLFIMTGSENAYLQSLQLVLSAALVAYTHRDSLKRSIQYNIDWRKRLSELARGDAGWKKATLTFLINDIHTMGFGKSAVVLSQIMELVGATNPREPGWNILRDALVVSCVRNTATFWPQERRALSALESGTLKLSLLFTGSLKNSTIYTALLSRMMHGSDVVGHGKLWRPIELSDIPILPLRVCINNVAWLTDDVISQNCDPECVPTVGRAIKIDKDNDNKVLVEYTNSTKQIETAVFCCHHVLVHADDHPCENDKASLLEFSVIPKVFNLISDQTDVREDKDWLSEAENYLDTVYKKGPDFLLPTEKIPHSAFPSVSETAVVPDYVLPALSEIRKRFGYIKISRNSTIKSLGNTEVALKYNARTRYSSDFSAAVMGMKGLFAVDRSQCTDRAESISKTYSGLLCSGGLPSDGSMEIVVTKIESMPDDEHINIADSPSITMRYSGTFKRNKPHGPGILHAMVGKTTHVTISKNWDWDDQDGDPWFKNSPGMIRVVHDTTNVWVYHGDIHGHLFPDGTGIAVVADLCRLPVMGFASVQYQGTFLGGYPKHGTLSELSNILSAVSPLFRYTGKWKNNRFHTGSYTNFDTSIEGIWEPTPEHGPLLTGHVTWSVSPGCKNPPLQRVVSVDGHFDEGVPNGYCEVLFQPGQKRKRFLGSLKSGAAHGIGILKYGPASSTKITHVMSGNWENGAPVGAFAESILLDDQNGPVTKYLFYPGGENNKPTAISPTQYHESQVMLLRSQLKRCTPGTRGKNSSPEKRKRNNEGLECPILHEIMKDPYVAEDGHTYEFWAIKKWLDTHDTSPMTNQKMGPTLIPNFTLKKILQD